LMVSADAFLTTAAYRLSRLQRSMRCQRSTLCGNSSRLAAS
jgi:hypothetical protein